MLVQRQDAHFDRLAERLMEGRVRRSLDPVLTGAIPGALPEDDLRYVFDLGFLREIPRGGIEVANPIYQEVIPRSLSRTRRDFFLRCYRRGSRRNGSSTRLDCWKRLSRSGVSMANP